jgi:hypothetical protein
LAIVKNAVIAKAWWLKPGILDTPEMEIRKVRV